MIVPASTTDRTRISVGGAGKAYPAAFGPKAISGAAAGVQIRKTVPDLQGGMQALKGNFQ